MLTICWEYRPLNFNFPGAGVTVMSQAVLGTAHTRVNGAEDWIEQKEFLQLKFRRDTA